MKLLLLADVNSVHTIKWVTALAANKNNISITLFSLSHLRVHNYDEIQAVKVITLDSSNSKKIIFFAKANYLIALPMIKQIIKDFSPDILHAHYASSYGILGALSGFSPYVLSIWGTDVYCFPKKTFLHKAIIKYNLSKATKVLSTSRAMAKEAHLYTKKDIEVTPFGIDLKMFKPMNVDSLFNEGDIIIGTVKTLDEEYGIEYLIKAFKIVSDNHPNLPLKLLIVGGGSLQNKLSNLTKKLDIDSKTIFTGAVPFEETPKYQNMLSISVSVSLNESFGVAVIEASSCGKPVVVSNVGGLPEVVKDKKTGIIVNAKDEIGTAHAIEKLVKNSDLAAIMGKEGRRRVKEKYNWDTNVSQMISIYNSLLK